MPRPAIDSAVVSTAQTITSTTETVVATSRPVNTSGPGARVRLIATVTIVLGGTQTTCTLKVERGTVAGGTQVGASSVVVAAAGATVTLACEVDDTPGDVAGQQYVATVTQAGGITNGTVNNASILAIAD